MASICWIISVLFSSLSDTWCSNCWIFICVWQVCTTLQCWTWRDAILLMHVWNLFQVCFHFGLVLGNDPYNSIHYYYYYYYEKASVAITWKVIWCFLELSSCYLLYIWRSILIGVCLKIMQRNEIPETPSFRIFSHWSSKYSMCACHFSGCQRLPFKNLLHGLLMQNCKYLQLLVPKLCLPKYWVYVDAMAQEALLYCKPILS